MLIQTKNIRNTVKMLDELVKHYKEQKETKKRDWKTYEQKFASRVKAAMKELAPSIEEAVNVLKIYKKEKRGNKPKLNLKQKTILLLLKHLFGKSNRNMANLLFIFALLTQIDVSYKTVERLYSEPEVILVLHNLHILLLKKRGLNTANCGGDGTGHSLTIRKHYSSYAQKLKEKVKIAKTVSDGKKRAFVYSFALMDIDTRMYIAYGSGFNSEQEAFFGAMKMAKATGIKIESIRLDRYYSCQEYVSFLSKEFSHIKIWLIPKKNATMKGCWEWKRIMHDFVVDPISYLEEYFQRNQSESGFNEDKKRTGWMIMQQREDRIDTAQFCNILWHNLFWLEN